MHPTVVRIIVSSVTTTRQLVLNRMFAPSAPQFFVATRQLVLNTFVVSMFKPICDNPSTRSGRLDVFRRNLTNRTPLVRPACECCLLVWNSLAIEQMVVTLVVVLVGPKSRLPTHVQSDRQSTIPSRPSFHFSLSVQLSSNLCPSILCKCWLACDSGVPWSCSSIAWTLFLYFPAKGFRPSLSLPWLSVRWIGCFYCYAQRSSGNNSSCVLTLHSTNSYLETSDLDPSRCRFCVLPCQLDIFILLRRLVPLCCASSVDQQTIPKSTYLQTSEDNIENDQIRQCLFDFMLQGCNSSLEICHRIHEVTTE